MARCALRADSDDLDAGSFHVFVPVAKCTRLPRTNRREVRRIEIEYERPPRQQRRQRNGYVVLVRKREIRRNVSHPQHRSSLYQFEEPSPVLQCFLMVLDDLNRKLRISRSLECSQKITQFFLLRRVRESRDNTRSHARS